MKSFTTRITMSATIYVNLDKGISHIYSFFTVFYPQMVDLHVLVMPATLWKDHLRSAENGVIPETISAGFIRYVITLSNLYIQIDEHVQKTLMLQW